MTRTPAPTDPLLNFVEARLDERARWDASPWSLADVASKRLILDLYASFAGAEPRRTPLSHSRHETVDMLETVVALLARPWREHPDYLSDWEV